MEGACMWSDMQEITQGREDVSKTIQGHKANISNPNTSEQSKKNSGAAVESLGGESSLYGKQGKTRSKNAAEELEGSRVAHA
ncbi:hypothetical protein CDD81_2191 [Ophiocordyceps australis]|uniref:Conidiation protein 6 n=1 Tax=Ophiocordyceps australis TaxID=1399860 RepID=A0A2C5XXA7_9HYPO|nr:hypothetical protein CDD81_2191 [Ophiocordyceps australis]